MNDGAVFRAMSCILAVVVVLELLFHDSDDRTLVMAGLAVFLAIVAWCVDDRTPR